MTEWNEFREQLTRQEPAPPAVEWPPPIVYAEFEKQLIEKPRPLVDGLLDASSRMIFGGGSKTFKTWVMSDLALSVVVGAPWWGFSSYFAPALYVNFELKPYYMQRRMKAIRLARKLETGPLYVLNLRNIEITVDAFVEMLLREIDRFKVLVVLIDPFYKLVAGRDERISAEINQILAAFDRINRLTGATIVFAAHFTKGNQAGKESIDRISGGGSINRDPDSLMTLTAHKTEHAFSVEFTLRDFPPISPFVVRWDYPLLIRDTALDPAEIKRPGRPQTHNVDDLLELLVRYDDELSTGALIGKAAEELGWSSATTKRKLSDLRGKNKVFISKLSGNWNVKSSVLDQN